MTSSRRRFRGLLRYLPFEIADQLTRNSISLDHDWPNELTIQVANEERELEDCFRLLHDTYVKAEYMKPHPSGMRILPQHLLPQTTTLVAKWEGRVIGTLSLIRDNPMGLPMEPGFDLKPLREGGLRLAEVSSLAVDPEFRTRIDQVLFPLFRFLYHYVKDSGGIQKLVIAVHPSQVALYRAFLSFQKFGSPLQQYDFVNGAPAVAMSLDFDGIHERWDFLYGDRPDATNLHKFFLQQPDHPGCKMPKRGSGMSAEFTVTPQIMENLFIKKADLLPRLSDQQIRVLGDAYPHPAYRSLIRDSRWSEASSPPREFRLDADLEGSAESIETLVQNAVRVRNVSRHGMMIWTEAQLEPQEILNITVKLSETERALLRAQVRWKDRDGFYGLRILIYSTEWSKMIRGIEEKFSSLAKAA